MPRRHEPCPSRSIAIWPFVSRYRCEESLIIVRQNKQWSTYRCATKYSLAIQLSQRTVSRACGVYEQSTKGGVLRGDLACSLLLGRLVSRCIETRLERTWAPSGCVTHVPWCPNLRAVVRGLARFLRGRKARACCGIPRCLRIFCTQWIPLQIVDCAPNDSLADFCPHEWVTLPFLAIVSPSVFLSLLLTKLIKRYKYVFLNGHHQLLDDDGRLAQLV